MQIVSQQNIKAPSRLFILFWGKKKHIYKKELTAKWKTKS